MEKLSAFFTFLLFTISTVLGSRRQMNTWTSPSNHEARAECIPIPSNLTLCNGIDYPTMRLPNLLGHETMAEVEQQSGAWVSLANIDCHPDTRLFLCSIFAPVCVMVDQSIPPCQELCLAVKAGCESRMNAYGFDWPAMLSCDKWPASSDMCIKPRTDHTKRPTTVTIKPTTMGGQRHTTVRYTTVPAQNRTPTCPPCSQVVTYENMLDHYCRSTHVIKAKIGGIRGRHFMIRRGISMKSGRSARQRRLQTIDSTSTNDYRAVRVMYTKTACDCPLFADNARTNRNQRYLIMANAERQTGMLTTNMIVPWTRENTFKKAVRMFGKINCANVGDLIRDRARRRLQQQRVQLQRQQAASQRGTTVRQREPWY